MAFLSVSCNNRLLVTKENSGFLDVKTKSWRKYENFGSSVVTYKVPNSRSNSRALLMSASKLSLFSSARSGVPLLGFCSRGRFQHGLSCNYRIGPIGSLTKENSGDEQTQLRKRKNGSVGKRFSMRFRPRLRLLTMRMKRVLVRSMLDDFGKFLRKNVKKLTLLTAISVTLGLCYLFMKLTAMPSSKVVPYSDLITSLQSGNVTEVLLEEGSRLIYYNTNSQSLEISRMTEDKPQEFNVSVENGADTSGREQNARTSKPLYLSLLRRFSRNGSSAPEWQYSTRKSDRDEKFLLSLMREKGTRYSSAPQSVLKSMRSTLITIISLWIPLTPLMWLLYRQLAAANSPAKKRKSVNRMVSFDDVEGVDVAKTELMEIVACLQGAINYKKLGAKLPRGVLLVGPPGTGKTLLARAVAGEAGVPFFTVSASEFVELFVGRGAARIRDLFNVARRDAPSIIFIDELDAVGGRRGRSFNDERDQTLNQLLTEMDGFESDMKVIVIAATNRPEALDPALCRPGRFSRKVLVGEPDEEGRRKILAIHLRGVPLEEDIDLICDLVASLTPGFVGADLANIVNEAALLAARRGGEIVTREDMMEALERAKFGINDKQLRPSTISKELGKLFPWMPSVFAKNDARRDDLQGPLGYQTLG
ncbi:ATP-dependent zinc metalloprotease FtsH isoform X1 [Tripterygium wilfordii]|uniref:ATP-dependent zinc metalloprotease FtsH isoform X1 n=1 Tax=Tripterygium wilfordii TaxID=458696 RepID=A0A7J7CNI3_TRIWF|nr:probable inactive ATP-dependent zinc metalloprotease FTSHI 3, chloroplastic [Tripterygium wilfordii]KAF5735647.1 ATP-dependent zinc metalloprotease FtsH isoform X1 [Tripterygium wilfordii]